MTIEVTYPATFRADQSGRPVVRFADLREAMTDGLDLREALEEAQDCLGSALAARLAHKEEIPYPSKPKRGERLIAVPLWVAPRQLFIGRCAKRASTMFNWRAAFEFAKQ